MEDETQMPPCNRLFNGEAVDVHVLAYAFVRRFFFFFFLNFFGPFLSACHFRRARVVSATRLPSPSTPRPPPFHRSAPVYSPCAPPPPPRATPLPHIPRRNYTFRPEKRRIQLGFARTLDSRQSNRTPSQNLAAYSSLKLQIPNTNTLIRVYSSSWVQQLYYLGIIKREKYRIDADGNGFSTNTRVYFTTGGNTGRLSSQKRKARIDLTKFSRLDSDWFEKQLYHSVYARTTT